MPHKHTACVKVYLFGFKGAAPGGDVVFLNDAVVKLGLRCRYFSE